MSVDELWRDYLTTDDSALREQLILQYAPLVKYVVGRMAVASSSILDMEDLLGFGTLGLIDAVSRFDPTRGVIATDPEQLENKLQGSSRTTGVFIADTWAMTPALHLTVAGRYNTTQVKLRDLVIATGASTDSGVNRMRFGGFDLAALASFPLVRAAVDAAEKAKVRYHVGNIFSADLFYTPQPQMFELMRKYQIIGVEMEAAGMFTIAAEFGIQAILNVPAVGV